MTRTFPLETCVGMCVTSELLSLTKKDILESINLIDFP